MISNSLVKLSLKSNDSRTVTVHQDQRNTAPYARGVALCPPLWRRPRAPLARPALLKLARLAGKKKTTSFCASRPAGRSRLRRTARYTATYPRDVAGSPLRRPIGGAATGSLRLPHEAETNLLCGVRPAAASRPAIAGRTTRYAASYCSRSSCRPQQLRATAPLARNCTFFSFARKEFINNFSRRSPLSLPLLVRGHNKTGQNVVHLPGSLAHLRALTTRDNPCAGFRF